MTLLLDPRQRAMLAEMGVRTDFLPTSPSDVRPPKLPQPRFSGPRTGLTRQRHKHPASRRRSPGPAWPRTL